MPRPKAELILTDDERQTLRTWASRPKSTQRLANRARIVLACADGFDNKTVATKLGVCSATVGTWRRRFAERRLEGLADEPRPGAPRKLTDADVERAVTADARVQARQVGDPLEHPRPGQARLGLSQSTVGRILAGLRIQPA